MEGIKVAGTGLKLQPLKKREEIKQISAKLHPDYDKELMDLIREIPKRERSKVYRDAVMEYLKNE